MHERVFVHSEFYTAAQKEFVLVSLDFPRGEEPKAAVPNPQRNDELMAKYGVRGFPTVMIVTASGDALGQTGYQDVEPAEYLADVQRIRDEGRQAMLAVKALLEEYDNSETKTEVISKATAMLSEMTAESVGVNAVADIVRAGIALTEDVAEQVALLTALIDVVYPNEADKELIAKIDPENEHGLMLIVVLSAMNSLQSEEDVASWVVLAEKVYATGNIKPSEDSLLLLVTCSFFHFQYLDNKDAAITWAQRAQDQGGLDKQMQEYVDELLGTNPFEDEADF
ncbi:MAG: thioredoxin family protein [Planctomycetes bacterium]|nr:thioredoxin family protein [Planctomycetota bacterium]